MKEYEYLDHTADIGVIAYGESLAEAFENAAKGMFGIITDLDTIDALEYRELEISASDTENLLVAWLNELIFYFDVENLVFNRFSIFPSPHNNQG